MPRFKSAEFITAELRANKLSLPHVIENVNTYLRTLIEVGDPDGVQLLIATASQGDRPALDNNHLFDALTYPDSDTATALVCKLLPTYKEDFPLIEMAISKAFEQGRIKLIEVLFPILPDSNKANFLSKLIRRTTTHESGFVERALAYMIANGGKLTDHNSRCPLLVSAYNYEDTDIILFLANHYPEVFELQKEAFGEYLTSRSVANTTVEQLLRNQVVTAEWLSEAQWEKLLNENHLYLNPETSLPLDCNAFYALLNAEQLHHAPATLLMEFTNQRLPLLFEDTSGEPYSENNTIIRLSELGLLDNEGMLNSLTKRLGIATTEPCVALWQAYTHFTRNTLAKFLVISIATNQGYLPDFAEYTDRIASKTDRTNEDVRNYKIFMQFIKMQKNSGMITPYELLPYMHNETSVSDLMAILNNN